LHSAGVKLPQRNTSQDYILQRFQIQEAERLLLGQKLQYFNILASLGVQDAQGLVRESVETWNRLVNLTYGSELSNTKSLTENIMREEYEKYKNMKVEFKIDRSSGKLSVTGLT